jgi:Cu+-exporting ATPase
LLTGESIPVEKTLGSKVYAATLNTTGMLYYRANKVGSDTTLANIIQLVQEAQGSKPPIARAADRISGIFLPIVIALSILTFAGWMIFGRTSFDVAIIRAVSVLVIACPCALGLATPIAIMVSSGKGAKMGILFRNATAIEQLQSVETVIFDKTGTLTIGKPVVTDIIAENPEKTLCLAASLEEGSEHPLSKAIIAKGTEEKATLLEVTDFQALPGRGIEGVIEDRSVYIGNLTLMNEKHVSLNEAILKELERLSDEGKTPLLIAQDKTFLGIIAVADTLRDESAQVIADLKSRDIKTVMLTGDNERTAKAIAAQAGVDSLLANQLPDQNGQRRDRSRWSETASTMLLPLPAPRSASR